MALGFALILSLVVVGPWSGSEGGAGHDGRRGRSCLRHRHRRAGELGQGDGALRKRILEICKCEGEPVKKGQVLVHLDDDEEQAVLREFESRLSRLKEDAARLETLVKRNSVSRVTLDDKLTEVREYEARVAMQKDRISDLALKSPLDGIVMRRIGEVGEIAGIGEKGHASLGRGADAAQDYR